MQKQPGGSENPIALAYTADPEREYDTTHLECLAVLWAVFLLCPYVEGCRFTVRTDHDALKRILNLTAWTSLRASTLATTFVQIGSRHRSFIWYQAPGSKRAVVTKDDEERRIRIRDKIQLLCTTPSSPLGKGGQGLYVCIIATRISTKTTSEYLNYTI